MNTQKNIKKIYNEIQTLNNSKDNQTKALEFIKKIYFERNDLDINEIEAKGLTKRIQIAMTLLKDPIEELSDDKEFITFFKYIQNIKEMT